MLSSLLRARRVLGPSKQDHRLAGVGGLAIQLWSSSRKDEIAPIKVIALSPPVPFHRHQRAPRRIGKRSAHFVQRCEFVPIGRRFMQFGNNPEQGRNLPPMFCSTLPAVSSSGVKTSSIPL